MAKKNYLTMEEQAVWKYIQEKETVDNELIKDIFPEISPAKRNKLLHNLYRKGFLKRARKDLYYNPRQLRSFQQLALKIREGYLGLNSALRYYNLLDYEDFTVFVMTKNFRKKIELEGTEYGIQFIPLHKLFIGFEKKDDLYLSSLEKTLFDCLLKPRFVGLVNITKAFYDAKKINWFRFLRFFRVTENHSLCQRSGYLLELMKKKTKLEVPSFVFEFLLKKVKSPVKLVPGKAPSSFNKKWRVQDNLGEKNLLSWWS